MTPKSMAKPLVVTQPKPRIVGRRTFNSEVGAKARDNDGILGEGVLMGSGALVWYDCFGVLSCSFYEGEMGERQRREPLGSFRLLWHPPRSF
jgi:hypothetical protein